MVDTRYLDSNCPQHVKDHLMRATMDNTNKLLQCAHGLLIDEKCSKPVLLPALKRKFPGRRLCYIVRHVLDATGDEINNLLNYDGSEELRFDKHFQCISPYENILGVRQVAEFTCSRDSKQEKSQVVVVRTQEVSNLKDRATRDYEQVLIMHSRSALFGDLQYHATSLTEIGEYFMEKSNTLKPPEGSAPTWGFVHGPATNSSSHVILVLACLTTKQAATFKQKATEKLMEMAAFIQQMRSSTPRAAQGCSDDLNKSFPKKAKSTKLLDHLLRVKSKSDTMSSPDNSLAEDRCCHMCQQRIASRRVCFMCTRFICAGCREKINDRSACHLCIETSPEFSPALLSSSSLSSSSSGSYQRLSRSSNESNEEFRKSYTFLEPTYAAEMESYRDTDIGRASSRLFHLRSDFDAVCRAMCAEFECKYAILVIGDKVVGSAHSEHLPHLLTQPFTKANDYTESRGYRLHYSIELAFILQKNVFHRSDRLGYFLLADDYIHRTGNKAKQNKSLQTYADTLSAIYDSTLP